MALFNQLITIPATPGKLIRALEANYDIDAVLITLQQNMFYMRKLGAFAYVYVVYPPAAGQTRLRLIVEQNEVLNEALRTQNYRDAISTIAPVRAYPGLANAQPAIDTASKQLASLQRSFSQPVAVRTATATWPTIEATDADWLTAPVPPPTRFISNSPIYGNASFNLDNDSTLAANPAARRTGTSATRWLIGGLVTAIVIMVGLILVTLATRSVLNAPLTYTSFTSGNTTLTYSSFWNRQDPNQIPECAEYMPGLCTLVLTDGTLNYYDTALLFSQVQTQLRLPLTDMEANVWNNYRQHTPVTDDQPVQQIGLAGTIATRHYFTRADPRLPGHTFKEMMLLFFDNTNNSKLDLILVESTSDQIFQMRKTEYDRIIDGLKVTP